ncbi:MAG: hypothetical protein JWL69_624 [Phycisphaerales bacterium]|nr:hypothetical protein [Phycisphaerales bacterium]MDB5356141.1 hypothetical protein [Phycisphaerales bacterium]
MTARRIIWRRFSADYRPTAPADRQALAAKLLSLASTNAASGGLGNAADSDALAERYALLSEAFNLAVAANDPQLALRAMQATERVFAVDHAARCKMLAAVAQMPGTAEDKTGARLVAKAWMALFEEALATEDYVSAATSAARAAAASDNAGESRLGDRVTASFDRLSDAMEQSRRHADAEKTLALRPDDPDANLTEGRYLIAVKGEWEKGLAALARGGDEEIKSLAEKQKAGAATAGQWAELGDACLAAAKPEQGPAMCEALRRRAARCFELAIALAKDDEKAALQKRLQDLAVEAGSDAAGTIQAVP